MQGPAWQTPQGQERQPQEPEAETGSHEPGAFDASQCRVVRNEKYKESGFVKFNLDPGAAVTTFSWDLADNRPEQNHQSKKKRCLWLDSDGGLHRSAKWCERDESRNQR